MSTNEPRAPARRADAERNRGKILTVARTAFAEADGEVSMAEISRRAGVGMATLYRNFPSRRELLEALYVDEVNALCAAAATVEGDTTGAVLTAWLMEFFAFLNSKRHIAAELLEHVDRTDPVFDDSRTRVLATGRPLLLAAQQAGEVRNDVTLEQIADMVLAVATINGDAGYLEPIIQTVLAGLKPSAAAQASA